MKSSPTSKKLSQKNLHSFFQITPTSEAKHKKCFIYDPENKCASFEYSPANSDIFIVSKLSVKLYYRPANKVLCNEILQPYRPDDSSLNIPLLKSNLQKAVRRGHNTIAMQTAIRLIYLDKMQFLRRLPIIYIEDVCLMDSFSIVVWLMMADKHYTLTSNDIYILLHCVNGLCECKKTIESTHEHMPEIYTHEYLENLNRHTELLCIYYRSQYGGMEGDMNMLKNAMTYYILHSDDIEKTYYTSNLDLGKLLNADIEILVEAIDFHPFPYMLSMLEKKTNIDRMIIREYIWNVESGYNIRKRETIDKSKRYMNTPTWQTISMYLENVRDLVFSENVIL